MKVVLIMFRGEQRREFPLTAERTLIGRRTNCNLRVPTRDVSREHCDIRIEGATLRVRDLDSANGTFVNDKRVDDQTLKAGDRLTVGPVNFIVQIDGKPASVTPADSEPRLEAAEAKPKPAPKKPARVIADDDDDVLDLDDVEFDFEDPTAAIEAILDAKDDEEDEDAKV